MRLELTTPGLKGRCSNQLSYGPTTSCSAYFTTKNSDSTIPVKLKSELKIKLKVNNFVKKIKVRRFRFL